jgi:lipopolysaccharide export system protein LptA
MKIRSCSRCGMLSVLMLTLMALIGDPLKWDRVHAAEQDKNEQTEPIRITADQLVTDNQKRTAVFNGRVTAVQGDTTLTAERLTIFYRSSNSQTAVDTNDIERLEAQGDVRIAFDNKLAVSNQAVYIIDERKLVLEGPESKVVSGQNQIVGSRITFHRNDGRMILESDQNNQVKAIIHSDQRGLN